MGRKSKETTEEKQKIIIRLHNQCKSLSEIAQLLNKLRSTVQSIIDRFCNRKTVKNKHRSDRPQALTEVDKRFILRQIKLDSKISAPKIAAELENRGVHVSVNTVRKVCCDNGYHGRVTRKKFWVNMTNRNKRLEFAKQHLNKREEYWNTVIFSDESKLNIFGSDGRRMVWRKNNTELNPQNLIPTIKHDGGSVLVWGCMSAAGVGNLHFIDGIMDYKVYIEILKKNIHASAQKLGLADNYIS